jgi:NADH-quinone oxidoreductase subunit M
LVLGAWYLLNMLQHAFFGPLREPQVGESLRDSHRVSERRDYVEPAHGNHAVRDMNAREIFAIAPIAALCLWIGVMPQPLLNLIRPDVDAVVSLYEPADVQRAFQPVPLETELASRLEFRTLNPEP